jgi:class 3 adenylate cyclase/tetratricopeptide (TPR) repeat protein
VEAEPYTPGHLDPVLMVKDTESGERKDVTVMIVDVAGSLAMAEALDPEDIHALMDGFFALALEAIHREGGTVNQFRGDGFMALFGAPRARGDDPARALRAALEVREQARAYAETVRARYGLPFTVRIGVSTGLVWVGQIGNALRRDYTAEGSTVGLAARLEAAATPGQILVGETTARRAAARFELVDLGTRALKGMAEPARVFELLGELALAPAGDHTGTPFVGRQAELDSLARALAGVGLRCAELRGEAGIGKSRIAREFARRLGPRTATLELVSRESGAQRAYRPWLDLLRRWPDELGGLPEAAALLDALEGRAAAAASPEAVARQVAELFAGALAKGPLLLIVDDAQWLDPSSRSLLGALCADPPEGSLAILATARNEGTEGWGAPPPLRTIAVAPLEPSDALRLAQGILAPLERNEDLAELAWRRGGGNPLFVEEVARSLRDGAETLRDAARTEIALARMRDRVPETLQGVVAARIDALPEGAKRLLEAAAVVGEPFAPDLLCEVEPAVRDEADPHFSELIERGLLARLPVGDLDFCHGVVRSGAYAQLVRDRRRALHRGVAEVLAKRPVSNSPDGAARIGHHFDEAGDATEAARHLLRAGNGYTTLRALREAIAQLGRAFELARSTPLDDAPLATAIGLDYAGALGAQGRNGEAAAVLETIDLARASATDRLRLAIARVHAGWVKFSIEHEVARSRRLVEQGVAAAGEHPGGADIAILGEGYLARIEMADGRLDRCLAAARRMRERATARSDRVGVAFAGYQETEAQCDAGDVAAARRAANETQFEAHGIESPLVRAVVQLSLARVALFEGDVETCRAAAAEARDAAEECGQLGLRCRVLSVLGRAELQSGSPREAHRIFEASLALDPKPLLNQLDAARGRIEIGDLDGALAALAPACLPEAPRSTRARALALRGLAIGLGSGGRDEGEALLGEALDLCGALGLRPAAAEVHEFLAEIAARRGDTARSLHHGRTAADAYAACGMPLHAAHARARAGAA